MAEVYDRRSRRSESDGGGGIGVTSRDNDDGRRRIGGRVAAGVGAVLPFDRKKRWVTPTLLYSLWPESTFSTEITMFRRTIFNVKLKKILLVLNMCNS